MTGVLSFAGGHVVLVSVARRAVGRRRHGYVQCRKLFFFKFVLQRGEKWALCKGLAFACGHCQVDIVLYIASCQRRGIHRGISQPDFGCSKGHVYRIDPQNLWTSLNLTWVLSSIQWSYFHAKSTPKERIAITMLRIVRRRFNVNDITWLWKLERRHFIQLNTLLHIA